jgi:hypothetical protein
MPAPVGPRTVLRNLRKAPWFFRTLRQFRSLNTRPSFRPATRELYPVLHERDGSPGVARGHYFHQDIWAARKIFERRPKAHIDVGSRIDGFVAHLLVFMPVTVIDIRPLESSPCGLTFLQEDATTLARFAGDSIDSISSLHAAEHFGLGRYSDPVDPEACFHFMRALQRTLAPGGRLYFSVPVGRERVEFNAHRVFAPATVLATFDRLKLVSFSYVGDDGLLYPDCDPLSLPPSELPCGLFEFTK